MKDQSPKVTPKIVKEKINLPVEGHITVSSGTVSSSGTITSPAQIIKKLEKAARNEIFPQITPA